MSERDPLPPWTALMSDGCSVPRGLRWLVKAESPDCCACCRGHDELYYRGGTCEDRLNADVALKACLISAGMPRALAILYFAAVRAGGSPLFRIPNVSWSYGNGVFRYTEKKSCR